MLLKLLIKLKKYKSNKILILGSGGFIGKALTNYIKTLSKSDVIFTPSSKEVNLLIAIEVKKFLEKKKPNIIIICSGIHRQFGDDISTYNKNVIMISNLCSFLTDSTKKIIFLSSAEVYGKINKKLNIKENFNTNPFSLYGHGKILQEQILENFAKIFKFELHILSLPGVYGDGDNNTSLISKVSNSIKNNQKFNLYTNGTDTRCYIEVNDLSNIIFQLIGLKLKKLINIYNVTIEKPISVKTMIKKIEKRLNKKLIYKYASTKNRACHLILDNTKLMKIINHKSFEKNKMNNYIDNL